jgi:excisionase family DNA binding protein
MPYQSKLPRSPLRPEQMLTTQQAADLLGVNKSFIQRKIDGGELTAYKLGKPIRVKYRDLMSLMTKVAPKPERVEQQRKSLEQFNNRKEIEKLKKQEKINE